MKASNYYAGHHKAQGVLVTVTRSGRTKPLDPRYDLRNHSPTGFAWGFNGSDPAQLALAILTDYFRAKPGGKALAEALCQPFKFTVIAALPECWKMNFEEVDIALCRTLTEESDLLDRVISSLESAVLDEIVRHEKSDELRSSQLIGIYRRCNYRNAERSFSHESRIRCVPDRTVLWAVRTRIKVMQPEGDVTRAEAPSSYCWQTAKFGITWR